MKKIDLNCDIGEAFGNYKMPNDIALMNIISSANIACGLHAGDFSVMEETVQLALEKGVAIGAHPGLPDLQGFGRRELKVSPKEVYQLTLYQIGALYGFVKAAGGKLNHVKPHGALYNMAAKDRCLADAIVQAIHDFDPSLILYALAGSEMISAADHKGLVSAAEVFADRSYQDDGSLTPRADHAAFIENEQAARDQVLLMVTQGLVNSVHSKEVSIKAETICLHGDRKDAVAFAESIKSALLSQQILIAAPQYENKI